MKYLLSISFVFMSYFLFSQDPNISNLHTFRTYINPGYVGFSDNLNVNIGHHRQWLYVPRVLETTIMSTNFYCDSKGIGLGLIALNNREGEGYMTTNSVSGIIAKNIFGSIPKIKIKKSGNKRIKFYDGSVNRFEMTGALQFGISQKSLDWTELTFSDQLDARYGNIKNSAATPQVESSPVVPDIGGGLMARFFVIKSNYSDNALFSGSKDGNYSTLGVSFQHLNQPEESFLGGTAKLPTRWNLHGNINLQNTTDKAVNMYSLNFLYQTQGELTTLLVGPSITTFGFISLSAWWRGSFREYRNSDAIVLSTYTFIQIKNNDLAIGASYDFTIGPLNYSRTYGTFELSLKMSFNNVGCPATKKNSGREDKRRKCPRPNSTNMVMMKQNKTDGDQKRFMKKQKKKIYYYQNML
jgi:type IX secretion system PorP/SprF family membrane protein